MRGGSHALDPSFSSAWGMESGPQLYPIIYLISGLSDSRRRVKTFGACGLHWAALTLPLSFNLPGIYLLILVDTVKHLATQCRRLFIAGLTLRPA